MGKNIELFQDASVDKALVTMFFFIGDIHSIIIQE